MANIIADRVLETSTTMGAGPYTLNEAVMGFRTIASVAQSLDTFYYFAEDYGTDNALTGAWEVGSGTRNSNGSIARTVVHGSSNNNRAVVWGSGVRRFGIGMSATQLTDMMTDMATKATIAYVDAQTEVGDLVRSLANKALNPKWLQASGGIVAKSAYPELFALTGDVLYPPNTRQATPTAPPPGAANGCCSSSNGEFIAIATGAPPYINFYQFNGTNYTALPSPAVLPASAAMGISCDDAGIYWALSTGAPNYFTLYKRSGTTFTKLADPTGGIGAAAAGCAFSGNGNYFVVTYGAPPYLSMFSRVGDTFTLMTLPAAADLPVGAASGAAFSYDGGYMTILQGPVPYALHYRVVGASITKMAEPLVTPPGACTQASYTADGVYLYIAHPAAPFLTIYKRSGDTFNHLALPVFMPLAATSGVSVSANGRYVFLPFDAPPFFNIYKKRNDDSFGRLPDVQLTPDGASTASVLSKDGKTIVLANAPTPFMETYRSIAPFDQSQFFLLPDPGLSNANVSEIDTLFYVKALP